MTLAARPGALRVAFDAAPARREPTGVGVYVRDLATAHLARDADSVRLIGVRPDGPLAGAAREARHGTFLAAGGHQRWLLTRARRDVAAVGADLAHFTNAAAPPRPGRPYVLTIQDLSLLRYPQYHPPRRVAASPFTVLAARRAAVVIVPSEATREELRRLLHVSGRRVVVIPHAASTHVGVDPQVRPTAIRDARLAIGLGDDPYILSVSTLEPRKNHARLVRAFETLAARRPGLRLVLVGDPGWRGGGLRRSMLASPAADRIHVTGYVAPERLSALMAGAEVFVYVSLYEGFGLPILDAMRSEVPVVTSSVSSMPEVAADAAVLVDPSDPGAIADGVEAAFAQRADLVAAGLARVSSRCWSDVAGETWDVYRWAAQRGDGP